MRRGAACTVGRAEELGEQQLSVLTAVARLVMRAAGSPGGLHQYDAGLQGNDGDVPPPPPPPLTTKRLSPSEDEEDEEAYVNSTHELILKVQVTHA